MVDTIETTYSVYKRSLKEVGIILGVAIVAALTANYFSPAGIALVGQWDTSQGVITAKGKNDIFFARYNIK